MRWISTALPLDAWLLVPGHGVDAEPTAQAAGVRAYGVPERTF